VTAKKRSFFLSVTERRTIDYIVRELALGRELFDILDDPYVRNRIPEKRMYALHEDAELLEAFMAEIEAVRATMVAAETAAIVAAEEEKMRSEGVSDHGAL
jgi:hypothetical protein